jgi:hypothetical protein
MCDFKSSTIFGAFSRATQDPMWLQETGKMVNLHEPFLVLGN